MNYVMNFGILLHASIRAKALLSGLLLASVLAGTALAAGYTLSPGDVVRITVFQNPELSLEVRVAESGAISYPLLGNVPVAGLSLQQAEREIATRLQKQGFVIDPQVSMLPLQTHSNQVSVLGQVNRPGRYPLETLKMRLSEILANAGGPTPMAADTIVLTGTRDGKPMRREIDLPTLMQKGEELDVQLESGDTVYVNRAPVFYIYGEVQKPGSYRLERNMSVMQALATGGGLTQRGSERGVRLHRRDTSGVEQVTEPTVGELLKPDDVIYVEESLF